MTDRERDLLARRLSAAVAGLADPATPMVLIDTDAFDANAEDLLRRAGRTPIRVASKSLRVPALLSRALARDGFAGVLGYALREGLMFELCGDRTVIGDDRFILAVASLVQQRVPVFLSINGPMGFGHRTIFLNDVMAKAVAAGIREHLATVLRMALEEIKRP